MCMTLIKSHNKLIIFTILTMTVHASQTDIFHSKEIKEAMPMWTGKMLHKIILYTNKTVLTSKSKVFNVQLS